PLKNFRPSEIIQSDLDKWSYRNQVVATPYLTPFELFLGVKLTEALHHLRPKAWKRIIFAKDKRYRQIMIFSMWAGIKVVIAEVIEYAFRTDFVQRGSLKHLPGPEAHLPVLK
ncbi:MAG TPA: hypothetical protein DCX53_04475, partial [Anaerolineae bacterium]|nr:hypothetical protein [Anaerolineae bacterium]